MTRLYLLRHGPTAASESGAPLGRRDLPVDATGSARWPEVKAQLAALGIRRVLCSPLQRSRLHAEDLAADLGSPCLVREDLSEQAFGAWEARPWNELQAMDPEGTAGFFEDPVGAAPPGGESFAATVRRSVAAFRAIPESAEPTLVLAHGGPLRGLLAHLLGLPVERALDIAWHPFGLSLVDVYGPDRGLLVFHNRPLLPGSAPGSWPA